MLALNGCDHLCVILTQLCKVTLQTSVTFGRCNDMIFGSGGRLSIFQQGRESATCLIGAQMATALGDQRSVKRTIRRNKSMFRSKKEHYLNFSL